MQEGYVTSTKSNGLNTIEFFHPAQNSLPGFLLKSLREQIESAGRDPETNIILLKSAGDRTFCAGASFNELIAIDDMQKGKEFFMGFAQVINAIRTCNKIVIGRIQGKAVGGGVGLASACDYCVATSKASARLSELAVGIGPFVIGPAVERKIGLSAFSQMALFASAWQTASWCREKGLYFEVFESIEEMDSFLNDFIHELLSRNPEALFQLKSVFWAGTENWNTLLESRAETSGRLILSDFSKNAIQSFLHDK